MKFLLLSSIIFTQTLFAIGALGIKNLNLTYINGSGSADFDHVYVKTAFFDIDINELTQIDIDYKNNSYDLTKRFSNSSGVDFSWRLDESTSFMKDFNQNVIVQANEPINFYMGTKKSKVVIPHIQLATSTIALEAKKIDIDCKYSNGEEKPDNYMVEVLRACLVNSSITVDSLITRQEEEEKPLLSKDFDEALSEAKHPLAQRTGIELDSVRTNTKDKQLLDKFDLKIINSQAFLDLKIKVWQIPLRVEFYGPISLLDKSRQVRINVQEFKILGVNFSDTLIKIIQNYLKKYNSKSIKVDYPYVYLNIDSLYTIRK